jgi:hypothetical protein
MERFIRKANIAKFNELLKTETDLAKRELLQGLLTEEEDKMAALGLETYGYSRSSMHAEAPIV